MNNLKFYPKKDKKITKLYNLAEIVTLILIIFAICFVRYILSNEFIAAEKFMEQSVMQTASNLRGRITNSINEMRILSAKLSDSSNKYTEDEITKFFKEHISDYDYEKLGFAYPNGRTIRYDKTQGRIPDTYKVDDARFVGAINGTSFFASTVFEPSLPSGYVNEFGVPVYDKRTNKIVGVLGSQVNAETYIKILGFNNYNKQGFSYVVDVDGNFIIKPLRDESLNSNFFERDIEFVNTTRENILNQFKKDGQGSFVYKIKNKKYIAAFSAIAKSDNYVLTVLPLDVLMLHVNKLLIGIALIVILFGILLFTIIFYSNKLFKNNEKVMYKIAFTDEVTGEGNKNKFIIDADDLLENYKDENYALITMDIARFKAINELYGYERADKILKDIYEIIKRNLTENSTLTRDYGASYIILYKYEKPDFIVKYFIQKIIDEISIYNEKEMKQNISDTETVISSKLTPSFGIYLIEDKTNSIAEMCEKAYIASRKIKGDVINLYQFYDDNIRVELLQDKIIEDEMYKALNNKEYKMYLQPKFYLDGKGLYGAEALVRWIHPEKGIIPPNSFIPLFEKNGFVIELDRTIWEQACIYLQERKNKGLNLFPISVNVSRLHLNNDAFISELLLLTQKYQVEPKYLELELTESACYNNEERFKEVIGRLKDLGFTISMDDFGTGYSSLTMLRELDVDILKLDRGFIKDTVDDSKGKIVLQNIINMANQLNMLTVAEGVEFEEQAQFLRNIGCQIVQGFLYGKPVIADEFAKDFLSETVNQN